METEDEYSLPLMQSKIDVQNQLISLLQTEIEMQKEKISSQDAQIKDLAAKLQAIQEQVRQLVSQKTEQIRLVDSIDASDKQHTCTADSSSGMQSAKSESQVESSVADAAAPLSVSEMARQTAEAVVARSGFVYDENSGLYYDYSTGYYYDPNRKLYYNGHTRTYYTYDESTNEYSFHSQLPPETSENQQLNVPNKSTKKKTLVVKHQTTQTKTNKSPKHKTKGAENKETEEGEISGSSNESDNDSDVSVSIIERPPVVHEVVNVDSDSDESISEKENAPCIRAIVQSSEGTSPELKKGSLFIVTCMGGTIGREGDYHAIVIPNPGVSKDHAQITFEFGEPNEVIALEEDWDADEPKNKTREKKYFVKDLGSQNGTFLNRNRLSPSNGRSGPFEIQHGSTLQIMNTILLLHIHSGNKTCGHCEPGLLIEKDVEILNGPIVTQSQREAQRRKAVRKMRQKYAIGNLQTGIIPKLIEKYKDRAEDRRRLLGSDHPSFKQQEDAPASIHVPINEGNKGFKMLQKMGWSEGKALGPTGEGGVREPVKFEVKNNRAGLGASAGSRKTLYFTESNQASFPVSSSETFGKRKMKGQRAAFLKKTIERYIQVQGTSISDPDQVSTSSSTCNKPGLDVIQLD